MLKDIVNRLRRAPLDFSLPGGRTIADVIFAPLEARGITDITVVDVGARNGVMILPDSYAGHAELVGFEPNPEEYRKLVQRNTDAEKAGARIASFRSEQYFPCAVWERQEERPFYITKGPGACTLMGEADTRVTRNIYLEHANPERRLRPMEDLHTAVIATQTVKCDSLDNLIGAQRTIDFLKIDVEGAEYPVLTGAQRLLAERRVLFIYSEFQMVPYYRGHEVFGRQHTLLTDAGYRLLDLELGHPRYRRSSAAFSADVDRQLLFGGDAFFAVDPDRCKLSAEHMQRLAAIAMAFGFVSFSYGLLQEANFLSASELRDIQRSIEQTWTVSRLRRNWTAFPARLRRALGV